MNFVTNILKKYMQIEMDPKEIEPASHGPKDAVSDSSNMEVEPTDSDYSIPPCPQPLGVSGTTMPKLEADTVLIQASTTLGQSGDNQPSVSGSSDTEVDLIDFDSSLPRWPQLSALSGTIMPKVDKDKVLIQTRTTRNQIADNTVSISPNVKVEPVVSETSVPTCPHPSAAASGTTMLEVDTDKVLIQASTALRQIADKQPPVSGAPNMEVEPIDSDSSIPPCPYPSAVASGTTMAKVETDRVLIQASTTLGQIADHHPLVPGSPNMEVDPSIPPCSEPLAVSGTILPKVDTDKVLIQTITTPNQIADDQPPVASSPNMEVEHLDYNSSILPSAQPSDVSVTLVSKMDTDQVLIQAITTGQIADNQPPGFSTSNMEVVPIDSDYSIPPCPQPSAASGISTSRVDTDTVLIQASTTLGQIADNQPPVSASSNMEVKDTDPDPSLPLCPQPSTVSETTVHEEDNNLLSTLATTTPSQLAENQLPESSKPTPLTAKEPTASSSINNLLLEIIRLDHSFSNSSTGSDQDTLGSEGVDVLITDSQQSDPRLNIGVEKTDSYPLIPLCPQPSLIGLGYEVSMPAINTDELLRRVASILKQSIGMESTGSALITLYPSAVTKLAKSTTELLHQTILALEEMVARAGSDQKALAPKFVHDVSEDSQKPEPSSPNPSTSKEPTTSDLAKEVIHQILNVLDYRGLKPNTEDTTVPPKDVDGGQKDTQNSVVDFVIPPCPNPSTTEVDRKTDPKSSKFNTEDVVTVSIPLSQSDYSISTDSGTHDVEDVSNDTPNSDSEDDPDEQGVIYFTRPNVGFLPLDTVTGITDKGGVVDTELAKLLKSKTKLGELNKNLVNLQPAMADMSEKLNEQLQQNSELKLQLNASQQAKSALELEIGKKEEIIIKTQAEALRNEQMYKNELKQLKEKLKENSKTIEKDGIKELEEQLKASKAREAKAIAELAQKTNKELDCQRLIEGYVSAINDHLTQIQALETELTTTRTHLANLELAFSDVHSKYEKTKEALKNRTSNEDNLMAQVAALRQSRLQDEERYEALKAHAHAQIDKANRENMQLKSDADDRIGKLSAIIKRLDIKIQALDLSLLQKTEECDALASLCDEVTGKKSS